MIEKGVEGVEFICANTDAQALAKNKADRIVQLGVGITKGLGAGADPSVGKQSAIEDRETIADLIDGADMVFLTAGMGGGTGTGAAPVFAEVAKELGVLTVAVVTKPFLFEGKRQSVAAEGLEALTQNVDSLIVIPNEKLMDVLGDDVSMLDAFKAANDVLLGAVSGIAEVIKCPGLVNVDFADVRTVMSEMGMAMMGSNVASGEDRARKAAEGAVASPLLEGVDLHGARGVLVNITSGLNLKMKEVHEVMETIRNFTAEDATVIVGTVIDEGLEDQVRVTIVATGIGSNVRRSAQPLSVLRTGTDDAVSEAASDSENVPAVIRRRGRQGTLDALKRDGVEDLDIPAFLRRQAD